MASFDELVGLACGHEPYPYQRRMAADGLPDLLRVPTGAGKTLAATLPWLWRRRFHPETEVRESTPRWLVFVLPMRVLVEQVHGVIASWIERLGLTEEVGVYRVMGGEGKVDSGWRDTPERDAVFVGTLDMLLSRGLNRGYGGSRFVWPIDFGLFNNGCQWVFDEIQLMGPALPTSRQLQGLREILGSVSPCRSMWMSATVDEGALVTVDNPSVDTVVDLDESDFASGLSARLDAPKNVEELAVRDGRYERELARELLAAHEPGTLTIAVLNTVERARELFSALRRLVEEPDLELVLLHSRFRPPDRAEAAARALAPTDSESGRIVVSTQVIEAGVDISATLMFTEAAPWPSIVQRSGRCNRDGSAGDARLLWATPPKPAPYEQDDVDAAVSALRGLQGSAVTPATIGSLGVATRAAVHPVLRQRDLVGLFDTAPDLSGNDLDVGRFLRDGDDLDLQVAWRSLDAGGPERDEPMPTRDERCPVPVHELRNAKRDGWTYDHLADGWVPLTAATARPGRVVLLRTRDGGYDSLTGWDPKSKEPVEPVAAEESHDLALSDVAAASDPITYTARRWVPLTEHLADAERAAASLVEALAPSGLSPSILEAVPLAARLHDIGKAHRVFQATLRKGAGEEQPPPHANGCLWAKSAGDPRVRHERRYFRHELGSLLALLGGASVALDGCHEPDLVRYLVAAHHGRVRLAIRSLPDESPRPDTGRVALGVWDGDALPDVEVPGIRLPACTLDLAPMELGDDPNGQPSWTARALALRDRADLGPFRLAFLEAVVRLADWRASRAERLP